MYADGLSLGSEVAHLLDGNTSQDALRMIVSTIIFRDMTTTVSPGATIHALRAAAAHVERTLGRALEPLGITAPQLELLQAIARAEGSAGGCSELGRQLAAPGPDVTRMLDRLDAAGLVSRKRDAKDRRVVHAVLTETGRTLLQTAAPVVNEAERTLFAELGEADREQLTARLEALRKNCRQA
jgi:MarR family transcriptional regulator, organic hydroperoxide resistance regulator